MPSISARILAGSPGSPWNSASVKMKSSGAPQWRYCIMKLGDGQHMDVALAVDGARLDHNLLGLAAMRAAVHAERAADAAGDAAIEGEAGDAGIGRGARDLHVGNGGAGAEPRAVLDRDLAEAAARAGSPRLRCRRRAPADSSRARSR